VEPNGGVHLRPAVQGWNLTGEFTFDLPAGAAGVGTYTAVVDALETAAEGQASNRDGQAKLAQGLAPRVFWPMATSFYDSTSVNAMAAANSAYTLQQQCADGTQYDPLMTDGTRDQFLLCAPRNALIMTVGHGDSSSIDVGSHGDDSKVDIGDIMGGLSDLHVLLSLHLNCYSGDFAKAMVDDCGADCAIGFDTAGGSIPISAVDNFSYTFWYRLLREGDSVGMATLRAADNAFLHAPDLSWYLYEIHGALSGGATAYPARYGE